MDARSFEKLLKLPYVHSGYLYDYHHETWILRCSKKKLHIPLSFKIENGDFVETEEVFDVIMKHVMRDDYCDEPIECSLVVQVIMVYHDNKVWYVEPTRIIEIRVDPWNVDKYTSATDNWNQYCIPEWVEDVYDHPPIKLYGEDFSIFKYANGSYNREGHKNEKDY